MFAAFQIIKSASRSLLLPFIALVVGASVAHGLGAHEMLFHLSKPFYTGMTIVGIIGLGVAVLAID